LQERSTSTPISEFSHFLRATSALSKDSGDSEELSPREVYLRSKQERQSFHVKVVAKAKNLRRRSEDRTVRRRRILGSSDADRKKKKNIA